MRGCLASLSLLAILCTAAPASADYITEVQADNPLVYWRFGEASGPTAADSSGNGRTGTYAGSGVNYSVPGALTGDPNTAVQFTGNPGQVSSTSANIPINASFTVEIWARSTTPNWNDFGWIASARVPNGFIIHPDLGSHQVRGYFIDSLGNEILYAATIPADIQGWHQYVISYDQPSNVSKMYVDGLPVFSPPTPAHAGRSGASIAAHVGEDFPLARFGLGSVDEFSVYPIALSDARVLAHFNAFDDPVAVPEPGTLALTGLAALAMMRYLRRRKPAA